MNIVAMSSKGDDNVDADDDDDAHIPIDRRRAKKRKKCIEKTMVDG